MAVPVLRVPDQGSEIIPVLTEPTSHLDQSVMAHTLRRWI